MPRTTIGKLSSQYFQYGFYKVRVLQKRRGLSSYRQLVPPLFSLYLILSLFFIQFSKIPLILIFSLYLPASIFFSFKSSQKLKNKSFSEKILSFFFIPIIFFTLHISYGTGYLFGLLYFLKNGVITGRLIKILIWKNLAECRII